MTVKIPEQKRFPFSRWEVFDRWPSSTSNVTTPRHQTDAALNTITSQTSVLCQVCLGRHSVPLVLTGVFVTTVGYQWRTTRDGPVIVGLGRTRLLVMLNFLHELLIRK